MNFTAQCRAGDVFLYGRNEAVRVLAEVFAATAKPSTKAGFVRDALVAGTEITDTRQHRHQGPANANQHYGVQHGEEDEVQGKGVMPAVTPDQLEQLLASTAPLQ
ncbi:hypothetical protein HaLaN_22646, partial [Haematococcus lacustris]